jgi:hypothetical protein
VVYPDLCENLEELAPLDVLKELAGKFGVPFKIGGRKDSFILQETLPLPRQSGQSLIEIDTTGLEKGEYVSHATFKFEASPEPVAKIACCFVLNMSAYARWVRDHRQHRN